MHKHCKKDMSPIILTFLLEYVGPADRSLLINYNELSEWIFIMSPKNDVNTC